MIEWIASHYDLTNVNDIRSFVFVVFGGFLGIVIAIAITIWLTIKISDKREEKKAKKLPSYIRAYDKKGNRIK